MRKHQKRQSFYHFNVDEKKLLKRRLPILRLSIKNKLMMFSGMRFFLFVFLNDRDCHSQPEIFLILKSRQLLFCKLIVIGTKYYSH